MGYTTGFQGAFRLSQALGQSQIDLLKKVYDQRHEDGHDVEYECPGQSDVIVQHRCHFMLLFLTTTADVFLSSICESMRIVLETFFVSQWYKEF